MLRLVLFISAVRMCNSCRIREVAQSVGTISRSPNHCRGRRKVPIMSQLFSSWQYICFRKTSDSNMGAVNLLLAPGTI